MAIKWIKTAHKGLRYYEHPYRKHGKQRDRYYSIRFKVGGKDYGYGVGWLSDGIPETILKGDPEIGFQEYCLELLRRYKGNIKTGSGPRSPKERRSIDEKNREQAEQERIKTEKENITFGDFMTKTYLPQCKLDKKAKTYDTEEMLYRVHLAETIGTLPFGKIAPVQLERIKKDMADKKKSDRTIQYVLQLTRQAFHTARKLGIFAGESPTDAVKWPKLDNMKLRYLSISEADELLTALAAKSKNLHDMALLSLHAGLRFGEIAALTWQNVDFDKRIFNDKTKEWEVYSVLAILNAKTGSRIAYLTERAKVMLKSRKQGKPDALIFPKRSGKDGVMAQASKVFADTVNELKLNDGILDRKQRITFHALRHTYATHLYESTHDLFLTQRSLGHTTSTMTARYAKMSEKRLREGAVALEKAFAANAKPKRTPRLRSSRNKGGAKNVTISA